MLDGNFHKMCSKKGPDLSINCPKWAKYADIRWSKMGQKESKLSKLTNLTKRMTELVENIQKGCKIAVQLVQIVSKLAARYYQKLYIKSSKNSPRVT